MTSLTVGSAHFSPKTRKALAARGITVVGITSIPDATSSMPWANASTGYTLDDNGTSRIRSYAQVTVIAAGGVV